MRSLPVSLPSGSTNLVLSGFLYLFSGLEAHLTFFHSPLIWVRDHDRRVNK